MKTQVDKVKAKLKIKHQNKVKRLEDKYRVKCKKVKYGLNDEEILKYGQCKIFTHRYLKRWVQIARNMLLLIEHIQANISYEPTTAFSFECKIWWIFKILTHFLLENSPFPKKKESRRLYRFFF